MWRRRSDDRLTLMKRRKGLLCPVQETPTASSSKDSILLAINQSCVSPMKRLCIYLYFLHCILLSSGTGREQTAAAFLAEPTSSLRPRRSSSAKLPSKAVNLVFLLLLLLLFTPPPGGESERRAGEKELSFTKHWEQQVFPIATDLGTLAFRILLSPTMVTFTPPDCIKTGSHTSPAPEGGKGRGRGRKSRMKRRRRESNRAI